MFLFKFIINAKFIIFICACVLILQSCNKDEGPGNNPPEPKGVVFKSVTIRDIPELNQQGQAWDTDGTGPDLKFSIDDNMGNWVLRTDILDNVDISHQITINFDPNVKMDTFLNHQLKWTISDHYEIFGQESMYEGFIHFFDWTAKDSVVLRSQEPRIVLFVEYVF